ncbi:MAG: hypothetical protein QGI78_07350 [Phycisphaerales bacterium]|jgi:hypothetical protein|nr:hypothetical protein [Phycisphaerales bacterium]
MIHLICSVLCCVLSSQEFEKANNTLFETWGSQLCIPEITIGVESLKTRENTEALLSDLTKQILASTQGDLSAHQRERSVPFALGMIEGVRAAMGNEKSAHACLEYLSSLDEAVDGWAESRLWRMRLHANACLHNKQEVARCANHVLELKTSDIEDQLVAVLATWAEVDHAEWDKRLASVKRHDLRWYFASGLVELNRDTYVSHVFFLSKELQKLGVEQSEIDENLQVLFSNLAPPIVVDEHHENKAVIDLSLRVKAREAIAHHNYEIAEDLLRTLVSSGCAYSASVLLTTKELHFTEQDRQSAIKLVLERFDETPYEESFWHYFAGSHAIERGDFEIGVALLAKIPESSRYFHVAQQVQSRVRNSDIESLRHRIELVAQHPAELAKIVDQIESQNALQHLLKYYIDVWHKEGLELKPWLREVVQVLVRNIEEESFWLCGEANRLLGNKQVAMQFFERAIAARGRTVQVVAAIADCKRDVEMTKQLHQSLTHDGRHAYWFWLVNTNLIRWHCEDGGDPLKAAATVNRLKVLDPSLGGAQFASVIREAMQ